MVHMSPLRLLTYIIGMVSLLMMPGVLVVSASTNTSATEQIIFYQDPPNLTAVDVPPLGKSQGDAYYFNASLRSEKDGPVIGELFGVKTVDKLSPSRTTGSEQRLTFLIFTFNDKTDQIVVAGVVDYPAQEYQFVPNKPVVRAVLSGTGKFMGVRGQVVSTRNNDSSYNHVFTLLR
jgi:hypothetical protein